MDKQGYKSVMRAIRILDKDRDNYQIERNNAGGGGDKADLRIKLIYPHLNFFPF